MENQEIRTALDRHWAASAAGDIEAEHEIYHDDVLVEYPQSGERIRGRHNIQALRGHHPAKLSFTDKMKVPPVAMPGTSDVI